MLFKRSACFTSCLMVALSACGGNNSPTAPPPPAIVTGTIGARIDTGCSAARWNITSVSVEIDGIVAGTAPPGGSVTRVVPVGNHTVTGRSTNTSVVWNSEAIVTTAANPDSVRFFACL